MGEWADSIINFCESCGEYLGEGGGYPTKCESCQQKENKPKHFQKKPRRNNAHPR